MARRLIDQKYVQNLTLGGSTTFVVERDMILTPAAKDLLKGRQISITYASREHICPAKKPNHELETKIARLLLEEYHISPDHAPDILRLVLNKLKVGDDVNEY